MHFSFAITMSTSYGCAPRYGRHLPAMKPPFTPWLHCFTRAGGTQNVPGALCFTSSGSNGGCWAVPVPPPPFFLEKWSFFHT